MFGENFPVLFQNIECSSLTMDCFYHIMPVQTDTNNSVENNRVEQVFSSHKIRASIFGGLDESKSKENHVS